MEKVKVDDLVMGSIITEPIYHNGLLVCSEGTPVSCRVIEILKNHSIEAVSVNTIFTAKIDRIATDFNKLNELTRIAMQSLDVDNIILCAKELVKNMVDDELNELVGALLTYDAGTAEHSNNVAALALACGIKAGWKKTYLKSLTLGALLHDLGKRFIPTQILNKEGGLDENELMLMKQHPLLGYELVMTSKHASSPVGQIILQHHENWDGTGYPRNLKGKISYRPARLVHICDVYEAMCARRSYKQPLPRTAIREFIKLKAGTLFDPDLVKLFLDTIPAYFVGEEVKFGDVKGTVLDNRDKENPAILVGQVHVSLKEFEEACNMTVTPETIRLIN